MQIKEVDIAWCAGIIDRLNDKQVALRQQYVKDIRYLNRKGP